MNEITSAEGEFSDCQFIDVREPAEFRAEQIPGARLLPLSALPTGSSSIERNRPVVLICQSGNRARKAAVELTKQGFSDVRVLEGGLSAWKAAGKPVVRNSRIWSMDRQVRFTAGLLVLVGAMGGWFLHPAWHVLSGLVGAGLAFSAVTDTCTMALVLARMPWNSTKEQP